MRHVYLSVLSPKERKLVADKDFNLFPDPLPCIIH